MRTQTTQVSFRLAHETVEELRLIKERDGIPISVQLRWALEAWVAANKPTKKKAAR